VQNLAILSGAKQDGGSSEARNLKRGRVLVEQVPARDLLAKNPTKIGFSTPQKGDF